MLGRRGELGGMGSGSARTCRAVAPEGAALGDLVRGGHRIGPAPLLSARRLLHHLPLRRLGLLHGDMGLLHRYRVHRDLLHGNRVHRGLLHGNRVHRARLLLLHGNRVLGGRGKDIGGDGVGEDGARALGGGHTVHGNATLAGRHAVHRNSAGTTGGCGGGGEGGMVLQVGGNEAGVGLLSWGRAG